MNRLILVCAFAFGAHAADEAPPPAASGPPQLVVDKTRLANGLELILQHDPRRPTVTVDVTYHAGLADEPRGQSGMQALVHALMQLGTTQLKAGQHDALVNAVGGSVSDEIDKDAVRSSVTVPRHELELALWLASSRMGWLGDTITPANVEAAKNAVRAARAQNVDNAPFGLAREKLHHAIIPAGHPLFGGAYGVAAELDRLRDDDVRRFYDDAYAPSNATVAVVGDFDTAAIKGLVDKYFGTIPSWPKFQRVASAAPTLNGEIVIEHQEAKGTLPYVELVWLVPSRGQPGAIDLEILAHVLGDGIGGKLQETLLVINEQAEQVSVRYDAGGSVAVFSIGATARPGVTAVDLKESIQAQLNFLQEIPISAEDVARVKNTLKTALLVHLDSSDGRAAVLQQANHHDGDPLAYAKRLAAIDAVTDTSVMASLSLLPKERRGILIATPSSAAAHEEAK